MKFAVAALVATTSAIQIRSEEGKCKVPKPLIAAMFKQTDANGNGQVGEKELIAALKFTAKAYDYTPTEADIKWVEGAAEKWAGKGGPKDSMSEKEFGGFVTAFTNHFGLCGDVCIGPKEAGKYFNKIDTNHNGSISEGELKDALEALAKAHNYKPTQKDIDWVESTAERDADLQGSPDSMSPAEFFVFANQFAHHFGLCPK